MVYVSPPTGDSNPGGEPEDHGNGLDTDDGELVCCGGEAAWCECEVGDGEKGPDGAEEHEVDGIRGPTTDRAEVGINYFGGVSESVLGKERRMTYCRLSGQAR